jgi:hypothetical protein
MKRSLFSALALLFAAALVFALASCAAEPAQTVCISEAMSRNKSVLPDETGAYGDWIELYNPTGEAVDLAGWSLTDDAAKPRQFVFPSCTLESGACLLLFADKTNRIDSENGVFHLPFSIKKEGESLRLFDGKTRLVSVLHVPRLEENQSFGLDETWQPAVFDVPTPGTFGTTPVTPPATEPEPEPEKAQVRLNEYSTSKTQTLLSEDGDFVSWVELYNPGEAPVALTGFSLTDNEKKPDKWQFPAVTLGGKSYLVVLLSGETKAFDGTGELHADFSLKGKEECLLLFDDLGRELDRCKVYPLRSNLSCGRTKEGWRFFACATPGAPNKTDSFSSVDSAALTDSKDLVITEVAAVNTSERAPNGKTPDYIELYNASDKPIDLGGYKLSDSKRAERFFALPSLTLQSGRCLVLWCSKQKIAGAQTVPVGLGRYGDTVYLKNSRGVVADSLSYRRLSAGVSCGRQLGADDKAVYFDTLTPGKPNGKTALAGALKNPVLSPAGGAVKKGTALTITCADPVYYTLDGSEPTEQSARYTEPLTIKKNVCVRARAFRAGAVPSDIVTATYVIGWAHTLPVVCLSTDKANLYSESRGIWADGKNKSSEFPYLGANFWQDWERPVHFEYWNEKGEPQLSFDAGMKVFGQFSRALEQKSVSIRLRDKYGPGEVVYPFFRDGKVNVFSSFVLRNSGQDFSSAHLRDAFCAMVIKGQSSVDFMDYRPVAVYVNGKYHGIYDLREKLDVDYLASHYDVDPDKIDLIKGVSRVQSGSVDRWNALMSYLKTHDTRKKEVYDYVCKQVDIDELIEYWMFESFFTNTDTGNIRFWRENTADGKWRWLFFDADWAFYPTTYKLNYIDNYLDPQGHGVGHAFSTLLMRSLMKNPQFRTRLLQLHRKHLKTTFDRDRLLGLLDEMTKEIDGEMKRHCERWDSVSYSRWQASVRELRRIVGEMPALFRKKMIRSFSMTQEEIETYLP